jgi:hypothetical protein
MAGDVNRSPTTTSATLDLLEISKAQAGTVVTVTVGMMTNSAANGVLSIVPTPLPR